MFINFYQNNDMAKPWLTEPVQWPGHWYRQDCRNNPTIE